MGMRYWEDLVEGERFTCRPVASDREGIVAFDDHGKFSFFHAPPRQGKAVAFHN